MTDAGSNSPYFAVCFCVKRSWFPSKAIIHQNICNQNSLRFTPGRWYHRARMGVLVQCVVRGPCRLDCIFLLMRKCVCVLTQLTNWRNRWTPHSSCCEETAFTHTSEQRATLNGICWHVYVGLFIHLIKIAKHLFQSAHYIMHCTLSIVIGIYLGNLHSCYITKRIYIISNPGCALCPYTNYYLWPCL